MHIDILFDIFFFSVPFPPCFTHINLSNCSLNDSHVRGIVSLIYGMPSIISFDLHNNSFPRDGSFILQASIFNHSLQSLNMENCSLSSDCFSTISILIRSCTNLHTLQLSPIPLNPTQLLHINSLLKENFTLTCFTISPDSSNFSAALSERNTFIQSIVSEIIIPRAFYGISSIQGRRDTMEDCTVIIEYPDSTFFGLFDGHGGIEAAEHVSTLLPKMIRDNIENGQNFKEAHQNAFIQLNSSMAPWCKFVGTTAVVATLSYHPNKNGNQITTNKPKRISRQKKKKTFSKQRSSKAQPKSNLNMTLTVSNVGDSRAVIKRGNTMVRLSFDHKAYCKEEKEYIEEKGHSVVHGKLDGRLSVSRAFGDSIFGTAINPQPYISEIEITDQDLFIILACDGVWDVLTEDEAGEIVSRFHDPTQAAEELCNEAFKKGSTDNISVIVAYL